MKLPYIQVAAETWELADQLGALLGVHEGIAFKMLCDLYRWGLSLGPADSPPEGICESARACQLLSAAVKWPVPKAEELVGLLEDLGLVEVLSGGALRVRGMDRYHAAWKKNRRRGHGLDDAEEVPTRLPPGPRSAPARDPGGTRAGPARQTQTQTQTQSSPSETTEAPPPRFDGVGFFTWAQDLRAELGAVRERPPHPSKLGAWYSHAMGEVGGDDERLRAGFRVFLADPHWRAKQAPWAGWVAQWERFVPPAAQAEATRAPTCRVCGASGGAGTASVPLCLEHVDEASTWWVHRLGTSDGLFEPGALERWLQERERRPGRAA